MVVSLPASIGVISFVSMSIVSRVVQPVESVAKAINQSSRQLLPKLSANLEKIKRLNSEQPVEKNSTSNEDPEKP